jgi:hypothetical protein
MNLNAHQSQTVAYLENRCVNQHGLLVYHHMGTGKTNTAIAWLYNRQRQYGQAGATKAEAAAAAVPTTRKPKAVKATKVTTKVTKVTARATRHPRRTVSAPTPATTAAASTSSRRRRTRRTRRRTRTTAGGARASSSSSSTSAGSDSSSSSRASRGSHRRTTVVATKGPTLRARAFDYLIVCPETIKTTWLDESAKMGFAVDKRCLMNYDEVDGLIQAKKFDAKGKNVIFDEAHNLCRTMRREGMKYYPEVMARLKEADKLLLLTGTPEHGGHSDFTLLINLVAGRTEFPLNDDDFQKKYRDMSIFEKRKNDWMFNWFKPVAWHYLQVGLGLLGGIIIRYTRQIVQAYCIRKHLRMVIPTKKFIEAYRKRNKMAFEALYETDDADTTDDDEGPLVGKGDGYDDAADDQENDDRRRRRGRHRTHRRRGGGARDRFRGLYKATQTAAMREAKDLKGELLQSVPTSRAEFFHGATESVLGLDEVFEGLEYGAKSFDEMLYNMPGDYIWNVIHKYVMGSCKFLEITHDPRKALREAPLDIERYTKEIGRYVSYYALADNDVNFGQKVIDAKPVEALYSTFQSRQCLFFIFATMDLKMVQTFADCDKDTAMLKIVEFRTHRGVRQYGRCVSNMWPIVEELRKKRMKHVFDPADGTVRLRYTKRGRKRLGGGTSRPVFVEPKALGGCSKFENIAKMLREADAKGERTLIRSDFKSQGIYLLSAYLNAQGIPHYYIRKDEAGDNEGARTRILAAYNAVYRPIVVKGKPAKLIRDYVRDDAPLDSPKQLMVGAVVVPASGAALPKEWEGATEAQILSVDAKRKTCQVLPKGHETPCGAAFTTLRRVYTIQYDGHKSVKQVHAKHIAYPLPAVDPSEAPRKVMLLDNDSSEGISLMGVEHVHLLEPLLNVAQRDQALARAIRFRSHLHLPPERRRVMVHTHVGVVRLSKFDMDRGKAYMQQQMFDFEKNEHINKHFSGLVPRAAKGSALDNPIAYTFDKYWNTVRSIHPEIEDAGTPDLMVYADLSADAKHVGRMSRYIRKTNVLARTFELPGACEANETYTVKTEDYGA